MEEEMKTRRWIGLSLIGLLAVWLPGCGPDENQAKIQEILSKPKTYVGSGACKFCHLEHYDSWTTTLHSRTLQDVTKIRDALIVEIDPELIRADLKKQNVPTDKLLFNTTPGRVSGSLTKRTAGTSGPGASVAAVVTPRVWTLKKTPFPNPASAARPVTALDLTTWLCPRRLSSINI
jgi:hypothetical protein